MILTYHEIVDSYSPYIYSVTQSSLKRHLSLFRQLASTSAGETPQLQITFDDGHTSHFESAFPLLEEAGIKATFCITAGWTDRVANYMTGAQVRQLLACGHRIFAHGWTHRMLTRCTPAELHQELSGAKQFLEDILGAPVTGMSAPHGRWNDRVLQTCADVGYSQVYTSDPHIAAINRCGVCLTGRIMVTRRSSPEALARFSGDRVQARFQRKMLQVAKKAVRTAIGEDKYRSLWRRLGEKTQELPNLAASKRRITVLQLISSGGYYGAESMLLNLSQTLTKENVKVVVGVFSNSQNPHTEVAERARLAGLKTHIIACEGRWDRRAVEEIRRLLYQHGVDVVHSHGSKANMYAALAVGRLPVSLLATYHIDWPDRGRLLRLYHLLDRLVLRRFTRIVAVSEPIARSLRVSGIRGEKISTIKNGIDLAPFIQASLTREPKHTSDARVIGVVGRLTPQKGHHFLLAAIPEVLRLYPNVSFVFVGDGPELSNLKHQVSILKLDKHVRFAGSQYDMPRVYSDIDVLVLPSVNEGMPMTLIEALASGLPVIATSVGDVPKLIVHQHTGFLVRPGNPQDLKEALTTLLSDEQKGGALALNGQRRVCQDYSASAMTSQYLTIYDQLKQSPSRVPSTLAETSSSLLTSPRDREMDGGIRP